MQGRSCSVEGQMLHLKIKIKCDDSCLERYLETLEDVRGIFRLRTYVRNIFHHLVILPTWHIFLNSDLLKSQSVSGAQGSGPQ